MSMFQPKEAFFSGNAPHDEVFRLGAHGCEVMFTSYEKNTVVGPSINRNGTKHRIIRGRLDVTLNGHTQQYSTGDSFEIPAHQEHVIRYHQDCAIIEFWFDQ